MQRRFFVVRNDGHPVVSGPDGGLDLVEGDVAFQLDREAISYRNTVPEFVSRRETLIIISTGEGGMRVYHYRP